MAIPFSVGNQVPNTFTSGSELQQPGTGKVSRYFTVASGAVRVDAIRLMIINTSESLVLESYWPVDYSFIP